MRGCPDHTVAANEGLLSCEWERSDCALQTAERRSEAGAACLHSGFFRAASAATWDPFAPASALGSPHRHGRGVRSRADVLSCRFDGERNADIQSAWAHHLSPEGPPLIRGQTDYLKKCHTHLNAAEEQPWGLPSNERTLTVSCNILSHNLGSARWRKRFWRIVAGAAFILPLELVIFACFATIGQSLTGVSQ